ncbi:MAG: glycosyltransferase family 2 protein, partial [Bacteriovoracaceae bacterium]|nr:glycosyltransferase family 2 protein [Bacteriovoracaceae bacterium]
MNKISVIILTQNNGNTISRTLKSVMSFDEIVVIDGGSTDNTCALAESYGAKLVTNKFKGFTEQRNFSLTQVTHKWCLVVDSDEEITDELRKRLYQVINSKKTKKLYRIMRTEYLLGRENDYGYNRSFYQERFFNKDHVKYLGDLHEYPVIDGEKVGMNHPETENLPKNLRMHHNPENSVEMILNRLPKYVLLKAKEKISQNRKTSLIEVLTVFPVSFIRIFMRRWRAGRIAIFEALIKSTHRMLVKLLIY